MSSENKSRTWKRAVKICLACILALDAALLYADWRARSAAPQSQARQLSQLAQKEKLLSADVALGESVEKQLPGIQKDCDSFYQKYLLPNSAGYSVIVADLGRMSKDAGVETGGVTFRQAEVKDSDLTEIGISASVQGDYQSLIRFLDALERSPRFYVLDGLTLASESKGPIKLNLSLRTYFRT